MIIVYIEKKQYLYEATQMEQVIQDIKKALDEGKAVQIIPPK